ncbi:hypothetical protein L1049_024987 [Liquidambar formosana]|uniref:peroxidase n=1 Tax=Liquidambar formosana TaxID=63359 RepID=A0AAP0RVY3_LIQFO
MELANAQGLKVGFYKKTCPAVEEIVGKTIAQTISRAPTLAAPLLRMHFHDCFVRYFSLETMAVQKHHLVFFRLIMLVLFVVDIANAKGLKMEFYKKSCPAVDEIVRKTTGYYISRAPTLAAAMLRMHFHDCFVRGCDGSVLLESTTNNQAEKAAIPNRSLRGFQVIDSVKSAVEKKCPVALFAPDFAYGKSLKVGFYRETCPVVEAIVRTETAQYISRAPALAAALLRMHFHDCFVRGCDGSVLLNSTKNNQAEKDAAANLSLRGFQVIDAVKSAVEEKCPVALFARDFAHGKSLKVGFYREACPAVEAIVRTETAQYISRAPPLAAALLRMHFHDCFVRGCDGSVLLNSTKNNQAEKDAAANLSLRGFQVIDAVKSAVEEKCPGSTQAQLTMNFYSKSCPKAEKIVQDFVSKHIPNAPSLAAALIRMHFHDCFVRGCDGSVLLNSTSNNQAEKVAAPNLTLRGFAFIDSVKSLLEAECPGVVSYADTIALVARDSIVVTMVSPPIPHVPSKKASTPSRMSFFGGMPSLSGIPEPSRGESSCPLRVGCLSHRVMAVEGR